MSPNTRLKMCLGIVVISAIYGILVAYDPNIATAISSFYVAAVLTIFTLTNVWKRPE